MDIGDFRVPEAAVEHVREQHDNRSERAREADGERRAPVTTRADRWLTSPSAFDFPGVDTPKESPGVLPKDLKQTRKPALTARARGESPKDSPKPERHASAPESESARLAATDISLSPEEAFEGVGATSSRAIGGFNSTIGRETDRPDREQTPPDVERGLLPRDEGLDDVSYIYENETDGEMPLEEFGRRTRRVKREMDGAADDWAAARLVASDVRDGGRGRIDSIFR